MTEMSSLIQQEEILHKKKDFLGKLENDCHYKERCLKYLAEAYSKVKIMRKLNSEYEEVLYFFYPRKPIQPIKILDPAIFMRVQIHNRK